MKNALHFANHLRFGLHRVLVRNDELRFGAFDVRALVFDYAISPGFEVPVVGDSDDRIRCDSWIYWDLGDGDDEGVSGGHMVDAGRKPLETRLTGDVSAMWITVPGARSGSRRSHLLSSVTRAASPTEAPGAVPRSGWSKSYAPGFRPCA